MIFSKNVTHKQKEFFEVIDLNRKFVSDLNYDYLNIYIKVQNIFSKRNNICGDLSDLFNVDYLNLCNNYFNHLLVVKNLFI